MPALLSSKLLRTLARLRLNSPTRAYGSHRGEHRSRLKGSSVEFSDYREYEPGDDFRHIDWNIYYRLDRLFVRLFTEEQSKSLSVLVDTSESMSVGNPSKVEYAKSLGAALVYVALWGGDEARIGTASRALSWRTPTWRGRRRAHELFAALDKLTAAGLTDLAAAMTSLAKARHPAGNITVLISDLLDPAWEAALGALAHVPGDAVLIHLLDVQDWLPSLSGELEIVDSETGERIDITVDDAVLSQYRAAAREWAEHVRSTSLKLGIACYQLDTSFDLEAFVLETLRQGGLIR